LSNVLPNGWALSCGNDNFQIVLLPRVTPYLNSYPKLSPRGKTYPRSFRQLERLVRAQKELNKFMP